MHPQQLIYQIVQEFINKCQERNLKVDPNFAHHFIHLLVRDINIGLDVRVYNECKLRRFIAGAVDKYGDALDATVCNIRLAFYYQNCQQLQEKYVREKYEEVFQKKLRLLIDDILQYPETSNKEQIEQMFCKMQVFIIASYNIGSPKDHVLLKQTRQSLNSVIGHGDLQNYIMKKKYHRLEYLQRLSATVCGIMIYNNSGPNGEKEHMRDIIADLNMAKQNTKESLDAALKRIGDCKTVGTNAMNNIIHIDVAKKKVYCHLPIEKVREVNKCVILFTVYERQLKKLAEIFDKTKYLADVGINKLKCVIEKIDQVLKFRTAIDGELIFPHFVYLSEVWRDLIFHLNHMVEINKTKDEMDAIVTTELEEKFNAIVEEVKFKSAKAKHINEPTFTEIFERTNKRSGKTETDLLNIKSYIKEYCSFTIALTNGLLVPAAMTKKLCKNSDLNFGFTNIEFAKYAERYFENYLQTFKNVIYTSVDLIVLFNLESEVLQQDFEANAAECGSSGKQKQKNFEMQTEMTVVNDLSVPNHINVTWNVWDFHRETIHMANMRKLQTHSAQTALSFGRRNAQNQAYKTKRNV